MSDIGMPLYEVTAVVEDNRENTTKVVAYVEDSFHAVDAILHEIMTCRHGAELQYSEEVVKETWALLYCSVRPVTEAFKEVYKP